MHFAVLFALSSILASVKAAPAINARHDGHDDLPSASSASVTPSITATATGTTTSTASFPSGTVLAALVKENAEIAQKLNAQFLPVDPNDTCIPDLEGCVAGRFATCENGTRALGPECAPDTQCFFVPGLKTRGTTRACVSVQQALEIFNGTGVEAGGIDGNGLGLNTTTPGAPATVTVTVTAPASTGTPAPVVDDLQDCDDLPVSSTQPPISVVSTTAPAPPNPSASASAGAGGSGYSYKYRRDTDDASPIQVIGFSFVPVSPSAAVVSSTPAVVTVTATASTPAQTVSSIPADTVSTVVVPPTVSSAAPIVTPTVAIGTDGIVTVTLVSTTISTVTVTAGACSTSGPVAPTVLPTVVTPPVVSASPSTLILFTSVTTTTNALPTASSVSPSVSVPSPTTSSTTTRAFGFTFGDDGSSTTAAPVPTSSIDPAELSKLLTATI